jgi:hydrogen peroxide-dependent heme synthase
VNVNSPLPAKSSTKVELAQVPLTIEGSSVLHQMLRFRWAAWRALDAGKRAKLAAEAAAALAPVEAEGASALYSLLGHKGDLLLVHFRKTLADLKQAELRLASLELSDFLEPASSYLSVIELGLYDSSVKLFAELAQKGIAPHSPEWNAIVEETLARQREAMAPRLFPKIPGARYICFYPMDRRRGEQKNWYTLPIDERQRQMEEHGKVGRRWAGKVQQIISGSIGFDDWEWGVDLFADEPVEFKKLIYEMRFDQVSAEYALFGHFYVGVRVKAEGLAGLLEGKLN